MEGDPAGASGAETRFTIDILNYRKDGSAFVNRLRIRPIYDADGRLMFFAGAQNPVLAAGSAVVARSPVARSDLARVGLGGRVRARFSSVGRPPSHSVSSTSPLA